MAQTCRALLHCRTGHRALKSMTEELGVSELPASGSASQFNVKHCGIEYPHGICVAIPPHTELPPERLKQWRSHGVSTASNASFRRRCTFLRRLPFNPLRLASFTKHHVACVFFFVFHLDGLHADYSSFHKHLNSSTFCSLWLGSRCRANPCCFACGVALGSNSN